MSQSLPPETPQTPSPESTPTPESLEPSTQQDPSSPEAEGAVGHVLTASGGGTSAPDGAVAVAEAPADSGAPTPATDEALLRRALEGLLFITDRPLSAAELGRLVGVKDQERVAETVEALRRELEERNGGYRLMAVAEGWQMATRPDLAPYVRKLFADRATMRLSTAAQETLSIVAYRQPLTRAEIEQIRGVEVIAALETLLEKRLLKVVGRKETVGRPLLYGTTPEFLRHYGLRSLEDMPPLDTFAPADEAPAAAGPQGPFAAAEESFARAQPEPELLPEREPETLPEPEPAEDPAAGGPQTGEEPGEDEGKDSVWPE